MSTSKSQRPGSRWRLALFAGVVATVVAGAVLIVMRPAAVDYRATAEAAIRAGRVDDAIIDYKNLLQAQPKDIEARRRLGQLYLDRQQPQAALKELRRATSLRSTYPDLDLDIARAQLALGAHREALAALSVYQGPRTGEVDALEATARAALGETSRAKEVLATASARDPEATSLHLATARLALSERDFTGAGAAVDKALAIAPDDRAALLLKGQIALAAATPGAAAPPFERVLANTPNDIDALAGLAESLLVQQRLDDAQAIVERLRKAAPDTLATRLFTGWLAYARTDWEAAATALGDVLAAAPTHPGALLMAADAALRQDKLAQAETLLTTFRKHYAEHLPAQRLLATVYLKQHRATDAVALLAPLAAREDADAALHALLARAYFETGDAAQGEAALADAERLAPTSTALKAQRAIGRLMSGDTASGLSSLEKIVADAPTDAASRQALTFVQLLGDDHAAALSSARALVELRPDDAMAQNLLAVAAAEAGDEKLARAALARALDINPQFAPALSTRGLLELRAGHIDLGRQSLEQALAADPTHAPAALALASVVDAQGHGAEADAILERFVAAEPQASEPRWVLALRHLRANDPASAVRRADEALAIAPAQARNRLLWSYVQLGAGHTDKAYTALRKLHDEHPDDPSVTLLYADAARASTLRDEARQAYEQAAAQSPQALEPWRGLFALALATKDEKAAEAAIARLRQLGPQRPDADEATAALASARGKPREAAKALAAAFDKDPVTSRLLQLVEVERAMGDKAAAGTRLTQWLAEHPDDLGAREALAMATINDGDLQGARGAFEAVLKARPDHAIALNNLAWLYDEAGDPRALDYAERARKQLPDSAEAADTLGWILVRQGQVQRGLKLLEQAKAKLDAEPSVLWHYAWALDAAGEKAAARRSVEQLLQKFPQFPQRAEAEKLRDKLRRG